MRHQFVRSLAGSRDPNFKNVTLLLHGDGTNGGQNNTFLDSGPNNLTITRNGSVPQGSFSPYGDRWSVAVNGSSGYLTSANNANLAIGNSDFTFECWANGNAFSTDWSTFLGRWQGSGNYGYFFAYDTDGGLTFIYSTTGSAAGNVVRAYGGTMTVGRWHHVAICRSAGTTRAFIDGVQVGTATSDNVTIFNNNGPQTIGGVIDGVTIYHPFNGYVSNLRLVIGTALYTSNFIPSTTPLTAIANTRILACASNRFQDKSSIGLTITASGTPSVQRFSPFAPDAEYRTDRIAGSAYFSGANSNSLSVSSATANIDTNPFTVESWVYYLGSNNQAWFTPSPGLPWTVVGTTLRVYYTTGFLSAGPIERNTWTHIAVTRDFSNVLRVFVNGVLNSSVTTTTAFNSTTPIIGERFGNGTPFAGYIAGFRMLIHTPLYTSNFTPPTSPPAVINDTRWLLNFTNANIRDNAMMNNWETVNSTQISTSIKKYGTGSIYNPAGSSLRINSIVPNAFGTRDFTIEFWLYPSGGAGGTPVSNWTGSGWAFLFEGQQITFSRPTAGYAVIVKDPSNITLNQWTHIAVSRASGTVRLFRDGVVVASAADSTSFTAAGQLSIGSLYGDGASWQFNGYFDDVRITSGIARYTANFTPPTAPLPDF